MATLDLSGISVTLPDSTFFSGLSYLNGTDNITNSGGANAALIEGGGGAGNTYSGSISDGSTHKTAITQTSGYVAITGANTYSGGTNLQGGTIGVGGSGSGLSTALGTGTVTMSAGTTLQDANTAVVIEFTNNVVLNGSATLDNAGGVYGLDGIISGAGALTLTGSSETTLTAVNTYTGGTNLNEGAVAVDNSAALGTGTLFMANGTLVDTPRVGITLANNISFVSGFCGFDTNNMTLNGVISGAGGVEVFNSF